MIDAVRICDPFHLPRLACPYSPQESRSVNSASYDELNRQLKIIVCNEPAAYEQQSRNQRNTEDGRKKERLPQVQENSELEHAA